MGPLNVLTRTKNGTIVAHVMAMQIWDCPLTCNN
jgi:hypothetical protein